MPEWTKFPHAADAYAYAGEELEASWAALHRGDRVPFPGSDQVRRWLEDEPAAAPGGFDGDVGALAGKMQQAWRCFHAGDFQEATILAEQCGPLAHAAANKATGIYATYLAPDETTRRACFMSAVARAERAIQVLPDDPNSYYFHAFNLGRYSQSISVLEALRQGMGGRIHASLERTLEIEPEHAEAHTALGMYHAEIINKVGKLIGGMTYGASTEKALEHFQRALELTPDAPIAHIEYGNGLYLLFGDRRLDQVTEHYVRAAEMQACDAMEKLDVEAALGELE
jgi:tetratricopeptide (TPR) repeat protein